MVLVGEEGLRLRRRHVFEERDGVVPVRRVRGDAGGRDVDVRPGRVLVRHDEADPVDALAESLDRRSLGAREIIGVRHRDVAGARDEALELVRVAALGRAG